MFNPKNTIPLTIVLIALALVYFGMELFSGGSRSKSFKAEIVTIDESAVSKMVIHKGEAQLSLELQDSTWMIELPTGKMVPAEGNTIENAISNLTTVKPARVAARTEEKWQEFQVDSTGTRVEIFEGSDKTLDIMLGRFGMKQPRGGGNPAAGYGRQPQQFYTYVRLMDELEVYACDDFMSFSYSTDPASYRNKLVSQVTRDSVYQASLIFPEDTSYALKKVGDSWIAEDTPADSASVVGFLSGISFLNGSKFADDVEASSLGKAPFQLLINEQGNDNPLIISAWPHPVHQWVIQSSANENGLFADPDQSLFKKLFPGKSSMIPLDG